MPIDIEDINKAIAKAKRRKTRTKKKPAVIIAEHLPIPPVVHKVEPTRPKTDPSPPARIICPLATAEQCFYGFFTSMCRYCHSLGDILDQLPFMLPECKATKIIRECARDDHMNEFIEALKSELGVERETLADFEEKFLEKIDIYNLDQMSLNQLEIVRAFILLKDEPQNSPVLETLEDMMQDLCDRITTE